MDGWMDGRTNGRTYGCMDVLNHLCCIGYNIPAPVRAWPCGHVRRGALRICTTKPNLPTKNLPATICKLTISETTPYGPGNQPLILRLCLSQTL